ncbi:MAG: threonine/serine exporter family protein [Hyphomicrobiales bacterium]
MDIVVSIIEKIVWSGLAAAGFGVLFNIPKRTIIWVFFMGAIAGAFKFTLLHYGHGIVVASFVAAAVIGFLSIPISSSMHTGPFVMSIPSVIPMIPGYFGYKTLLGILKMALARDVLSSQSDFFIVMHNGLKLFFVLLALSIGISLPWLALRHKIRRKLILGKAEDLL